MANVSSKSECLNRTKLSERQQPTSLPHPTFIGLLQEFAAKLVLEVFGAGGAIWGFSEVCGLRTKRPESIRFWRFVAITVAVLFGLTWLRRLRLAVSALLQHEKKQLDKANNGMGTCKINDHLTVSTEGENDHTDHSSKSEAGEISPIGIQLSHFLFGRKEEIDNDLTPNNLFLDDEVQVFCLPTEDNESTGLASSPRSPKAQL